MSRVLGVLCVLCVVVSTLGENGDLLGEARMVLSLTQEVGPDTCPVAVKRVCPCEYLWWVQNRCQDFGKHMSSKYDNDIDTVSVSALYYYDCLKATFTCELSHPEHGPQTLEYDFNVQPCQRNAILSTRYTFHTKEELRTDLTKSWFPTTHIMREGEKKLVLKAPDHPETSGEATTHYAEYLTLYFKDLMRFNEATNSYQKAFHVLFEVEESDKTLNPAPEWRQLTYDSQMDKCGVCHGSMMGCMGSSTSAVILLSLFVSVICLLVTILLVCKKKSLLTVWARRGAQ